MDDISVYEINLRHFQQASALRAERGRKCALVVEDQRIFRQIIVEMLSEDFDVCIAADGRQALKVYESNAPDIVFLDIDLPCLDGQQVLSTFLAADPQCFAIMTTASNDVGNVQRALGNGAKGYLLKPFTRRKIKNYIALFYRSLAPG